VVLYFMSCMANLNLYLLGSPQVELAEAGIEVKPRRALALLIYLCRNGWLSWLEMKAFGDRKPGRGKAHRKVGHFLAPVIGENVSASRRGA